MSNYTIHNLETAPEGSKNLLENSIKAYGMIPNLLGVMAESPSLLEAYKSAGDLFQNSSFNNEELTVVWQTINVEHECHYCIPGHTAIAQMMGVDPALNEALRNKAAMPTPKLQALHDTTLAMVRSRGRLTEDEKEAFYAAGYGKNNLLDIILGLSQKVISNYVNHIAETPVDEPFKKFV